MVHYFCNKEEIEKNALDLIIEADNEMDKICVFPDIHYCSEKSIPIVTVKFTEI